VRVRSVTPAVAFWLVGFAFAVVMLGTTLPTPLYPIYRAELGFSELLVTVIFAVYALGVIAGLLLFGGLSDTIGRRRVLLPGLGLAAASAVAFLLAHGLGPILAGRVLSGLSAGMFTGTATAALVDLVATERRGFATRVAVAANLGGLGLGTLLSGLLAQYAPSPLLLPFWTHLALLAVAVVGVALAPETVAVTGAARMRLQRLGVPAEVRAVFIRAATAGVAAFAVSGVFGAVVPGLLAAVLHHPSHALAGLLVFLLFTASAGGQLGLHRIPERAALPLGCVLLLAGAGLLALSIAAETLAALVASALVAGLGQGVVVGAGLAAINRGAPGERRGEVASAFFVVLYTGLVLPVVGVGLAVEAIGEQAAGLVFSGAVGAVVAGVLASLARRSRVPA